MTNEETTTKEEKTRDKYWMYKSWENKTNKEIAMEEMLPYGEISPRTVKEKLAQVIERLTWDCYIPYFQSECADIQKGEHLVESDIYMVEVPVITNLIRRNAHMMISNIQAIIALTELIDELEADCEFIGPKSTYENYSLSIFERDIEYTKKDIMDLEKKIHNEATTETDKKTLEIKKKILAEKQEAYDDAIKNGRPRKKWDWE